MGILHHPARRWTSQQREELPIIQNYIRLTKTAPNKYWLTEPVSSPMIQKICLEWNGQLVTTDLLRFQRTIVNFYISR